MEEGQRWLVIDSTLQLGIFCALNRLAPATLSPGLNPHYKLRFSASLGDAQDHCMQGLKQFLNYARLS